MSDIAQWSTSAASNNSAAPDGWPEGQAPSTLNDCGRELMAAVARFYKDVQGTLVTSGSGNGYTLTTNNNYAALADQSLLVFRSNRDNTGAATLNVDALGAKSIRLGGIATQAGDIKANTIYAVAYNSSTASYDLLGPTVYANTFTATHTGMTTSITSTGRYRVVGGIATVNIALASGTSNATSYTITGLPAVAWPAVETGMFAANVINNGTSAAGFGRVSTAGVITMLRLDASVVMLTTWTSSGTKGITTGGLSGSWAVA